MAKKLLITTFHSDFFVLPRQKNGLHSIRLKKGEEYYKYFSAQGAGEGKSSVALFISDQLDSEEGLGERNGKYEHIYFVNLDLLRHFSSLIYDVFIVVLTKLIRR